MHIQVLRQCMIRLWNIPHKERKLYLESLLKEYGVQEGLVLDLGCGTGTMTELFAADGYDMIGVNNSEEMLEIAREKQMESGHEILYLLQDMREFELYGTVRAVYSICDSLNYITDPEELVQVFRWVNNYLDPGAMFIFDFNTEVISRSAWRSDDRRGQRGLQLYLGQLLLRRGKDQRIRTKSVSQRRRGRQRRG